MSNNSEQSENLNQKSSETSQELEPPKKPEPIEFEQTRALINSEDHSNIVDSNIVEVRQNISKDRE